MAQQTEAFAAKLADMSLMHGTHIVEEDNKSLQIVLREFTSAYTHTHIHTTVLTT